MWCTSEWRNASLSGFQVVLVVTSHVRTSSPPGIGWKRGSLVTTPMSVARFVRENLQVGLRLVLGLENLEVGLRLVLHEKPLGVALGLLGVGHLEPAQVGLGFIVHFADHGIGQVFEFHFQDFCHVVAF